MARISICRGGLPALSLLILAVSACTSSRTARFILGSGPRNRPIRVEVINDNFLDMTVYAVGGGVDIRLGDVTGKSKASFTLNPDRISAAHGLRLRADPLGSRNVFVSEEVAVSAGATVVLNISPDLRMSFITLR